MIKSRQTNKNGVRKLSFLYTEKKFRILKTKNIND